MPINPYDSTPKSASSLVVHHLGRSQSERIVWLCEELRIPYGLKTYARDKTTRLAPAEYRALHPIGAAPVIHDGDLVLAESGAVVEYILTKYGNGQVPTTPTSPPTCIGSTSPTAHCSRPCCVT